MTVLGSKCLHCGKEYPFERLFEGCPACRTSSFAANLDAVYDFGSSKELCSKALTKKRQELGMAAYRDFLPVSGDFPFFTLGAGSTPLIQCTHLNKDLDITSVFLKDESRNPTGSLKDRQAAVGGNVALQFGSQNFIAMGNMGAAAAAYAARYRISAITFEEEAESPTAMFQVRAYGGNCVIVKKREDRYTLMKEFVEQSRSHPLTDYTQSPTGDPYSQDGAKTIAYEICEDLGWQSPDKVIMPTGKGLCLYGVWKGFREFYELGLVDSVPCMIAVESCAGGSFSKSNLNDPQHIAEVKPKLTVARHAVVPKGSYKGFKAIVESNGFPILVSDREILSATLELAGKEGVLASTTSATTIAALKKLREDGQISKKDLVVCVITGGGLKDVDFIEKELPKVPLMNGSSWDEFTELLARHYKFAF